MNRLLRSQFWWLYLVAGFILINYAVSSLHYRIDLTAEKRYTLSNSTRNMVSNLDENVNIDVFLEGDFKSGFKKLSNSTRELLQDLKDYSKGKLSFNFIDPLATLNDSLKRNMLDSLNAMGIQPVTQVAQSEKGNEQLQRIVIPGAIVSYKGKHYPVNLLRGVSNTDEENLYNNAEALLEYKFADAIDKLTRKERPRIAYLLGHDEPVDQSSYYLLTGFDTTQYAFYPLNLKKTPFIPQEFNMVLMVKPNQKFEDDDKLKIDQYLMRGGHLMCFIDNLLAEMDSLKLKNEVLAYDRGLNMDDLFFKYGARVNHDLVQDIQCAPISIVTGMIGNKPQMQNINWPYYPLLTGSLTHPISKNLDPVYAKFPNSIDTVKAPGIIKTPILTTSKNGRIIGTPAIVSLDALKYKDDVSLFNKPNVITGLLLEGKFNSLYANRISTAVADSMSQVYHYPYLSSANKDGKIIIISNAEIVLNDVSQRGPLPMGYHKDINYTFANRDFFMNCVEYMVSNGAVLETRSKDFTLRLLDKEKVEEERNIWTMINIGLPLLLIVIFGAVFNLLRKRKFAK